MMAIIHSLKCAVPFSFAVPLFSLAVTHCYSLSHFVTHFHSLSLVVPLVVTRCNSLSLLVIRCHSLYHSLSLVVIRCHSLYYSLSLVFIRCHSSSLHVPLVCLFINDQRKIKKLVGNVQKKFFKSK